MKYKRYEYWHTSADTGKVFLAVNGANLPPYQDYMRT
jgi:hypothetical protein